MSEKQNRITLNISREMNHRMKKAANKRFISKSAYARQILAEHLEQDQPDTTHTHRRNQPKEGSGRSGA